MQPPVSLGGRAVSMPPLVMKKTDRALHELSLRVMKAHAGRREAAAPADAMQASCGELYRVLETAMGPAGLQALIGRAIQLTAREYPWLAGVKPGTAPDCALDGLGDAAGAVGAETAAEGCAALLAVLLSLLITFIGEDLTFRFVRQAWPTVPFTRFSDRPRNDGRC
jgi:hypothetical protein